MKKNLLALLSIATIIIAGCTDTEVIKINSENWISDEWLSAEKLFDKQIEQSQYIKDLENFLSYDILLNTEQKPFTSSLYFDADFDENSSVQWWLEFSQKKVLKSNSLESIDIEYDLDARKNWKDLEPIYSSWNVTLLYQNDQMYAYLHNFWIFMWEWNMPAKMYTLLWDMIKDRWVDLEVDNWWLVSVSTEEDKKLPYIIWTLKNILETKDIQSSPNFLNSVAEMIDVINLHINLWISTNELSIIDYEIAYSELWHETIQKEFTGSFQWKDSAFDLSFIVSQKWVEIHLYNIREYDDDIEDYKDMDSEFLFSLQENKKSEYSVEFQSIKYRQKVIDLQWKIKYSDDVKFSADFVLEPIELISWQKISWEIKWNIQKENLNGTEIFPELSWEIMSINEILSAL
jgi:hypothetical protein